MEFDDITALKTHNSIQHFAHIAMLLVIPLIDSLLGRFKRMVTEFALQCTEEKEIESAKSSQSAG
jgi:hypothetical protein